MRFRMVLAAVSVVGLVAVGCSDDSDDSGDATTTTVEESTATSAEVSEPEVAEPESPTASDPSDSEYDVPMEWALEESFDGVLRNPVAFHGGLAGVYSEVQSPRGVPWTSADGIDWEPAAEPPVGEVERLVAQDGDLFVETSAGLWALRQDDEWREVIPYNGFLRTAAAVGPDRIVVFNQGIANAGYVWDFELVGVFDTKTLEPVEFAGMPDIDIERKEGEGAVEGRVIAVDDGFLAERRWDQLRFSADGSSWVEHPNVTTDTVDVGGTSIWDGQPVTHGGLNLVAGTQGELLVTDDGLEFEPTLTEPSGGVDWPGPQAVATDVGFFAFFDPAGTDSSIVYSANGMEWQTVQPPPTWSQRVSPSLFFSGTPVMTVGDDLVMVVHRGDVGSFGAVEDPVTEIWRAALPSPEGA